MKANHVGPFTVCRFGSNVPTDTYSHLASAVGAAAAAAHYDGCAYVVRRGDGRKVRTVAPDGPEARRFAAGELLRRAVPKCGTVYVEVRPGRASRSARVHAFATDDTGRIAHFVLTGAVAALRGSRIMRRDGSDWLAFGGHGYSIGAEVADSIGAAIGRKCCAETL